MKLQILFGLVVVAVIIIAAIVLIGRLAGFFKQGEGIVGAIGEAITRTQRNVGDAIATAIGIPVRPTTGAVTDAEILATPTPTGEVRTRAQVTLFRFMQNRARQLTDLDPTLSDAEAIEIAKAEFERSNLLGPRLSANLNPN